MFIDTLLKTIDTQLLEKSKSLQKGRVSSNDTNVPTNNVATEVLKKAKTHQEGRVAKNATTVTTSLLNSVGQIIGKLKVYQKGRSTDDVGSPTFNFTTK